VWRRIERWLGRVLGMDAALTSEIVSAARAGDDGRLLLRCAAFMVATAPASRRVVPRALRERAVGSLVTSLFERQVWEQRVPLAYAGRPPRLMPPP
jgi:hypothetical protein